MARPTSFPPKAVEPLYGVWEEKRMYGKRYWGIIRSHFVIDEAGHIVDARYGVKPGAGVSGALVALGVQ